jgi:hypothetical protein
VKVQLSAVPASARWFLGGSALPCDQDCELERPAGAQEELTVKAAGYADQKIPVSFDKPRELRVVLVAAPARVAQPAKSTRSTQSTRSTEPVKPAPKLGIETDNPYQ